MHDLPPFADWIADARPHAPRPDQAVFSPREREQLLVHDQHVRDRAARSSATACEAALTRRLLARSQELLPDHPYVMLWEWDVVPGLSQYGKGDLVFTDGQGALAVVETKWLGGGTGRTARNARRKRRRKLDEQAWVYGHLVCKLFRPKQPVLAYSCTEELRDMLRLEARFEWTEDGPVDLEAAVETAEGVAAAEVDDHG
jgi:hypothetical protein